MVGWTGWGFLFGVDTYLFSWATICAHSATAVLLKRDVFNRITMGISYFVCLVIPLVLACLPFNQGNMKVLAHPFTGGPAGNWAYISFYWVLMLCLLVGVISISIILVQMARVSDMSSSWSIKSNLRLIAFLFVMVVWAVIWVSFRFYAQPGLPTLAVNYGTMMNCNLFTYCNRWDVPGFYFNLGLTWTTTIAIFLGSFLLVCLFLAQPELFTTPLSERAWPWRSLISAGASATTTTAGSSSSSSSESAGDTFLSDLQ